MGKCVDRGYIPYAEITICDGCFHKDVCGDRDYLTENKCSARAGGCRCGECMYWDGDGRCEPPENGLIREYTKPTDFCSYGKPREAQKDG